MLSKSFWHASTRATLLLLLALTISFHLAAQVSITLRPSLPSPQPVGTSVLWTATLTGASGTPLYRFLTRPAASTAWNLVRDNSQVKTLPWTMLQEGSYDLSVYASIGPKIYQAQASFQFISRVTAGVPVVSATQNPLVALYSAPPCTAGSVSVSFWMASGGPEQTTPAQPCQPGSSSNFYIAGMRAGTPYAIQQQVIVGHQSTPGPVLSFKPGTVNYSLPKFNIVTPPNSQTSTKDDIMLMSFKALKNAPPYYPPVAYDLLGNVLWYYWNPESPKTPQNGYALRPVAGGTVLVFEDPANALREIDPAGNVVRETNKLPINVQLQNLGQDPTVCLSHEALRLPNGHTVTIGSVERLLTNVQGPGPVDVLGDLVIDLDQNFQVAWTWNSFNALDNSRKAVLGEKYSGSCPLALASQANDWTHANSVLLTSDGNLLVSLRNQDWVVKINYQNGTGDGHVIWELGPQGNFSIVSSNPWPWFSHQHDIEFDGVNYEVFDNGNTRVAPPPIGLGSGNSRGYVFSLDENAMTATVLLAAELGTYSPAFGSAQLLSNGNYSFLSGNINTGGGQSTELLPSGAPNLDFFWHSAAYRTFRMTDLYTYTQ
jgi:arylsulfate sulfotransferase